ncbi:LysR family transcriptional regulator [Rhizobium lusitanum]|uniref:HTH-type transcriptional regulator TtuA n=1 Tax=Rhizobium lusitanum TaxID=293958 RepID=A0A6L9UFP4_9HYPH|nr:LysR family transcriptional regulator [Rhizobium lusitanum]NEI73132.1 LysR family transcriptional regulator [Rhizobium lusitanum]
MDLRRLACFVALAEELHFRRAAERCHLTQPALSQQLRHLEDELEAQLVYRNKRRVSLTPAGEVFADEARKMLHMSKQAAQLVRRTARGELGQLFVGCTAPGMFIALPEIVRMFSKELPDVGLVIQEMTTAEQEEALRHGRIQLGIIHPPLDDSSISCLKIAEVAFKLVISNQNPLSRKRKLTLGDLASENFIMFPRKVGPQLYDQIVALCQNAGFSPRMIHEASPAQSIVAMAAANFGVGWIASRYQQFARPGIVYRELLGPAPFLTLGIAYNEGETAPAIRKFLAVATEIGKTIV